MRVLKIVGKAAVSFYEELFFYFLAGIVHLVCWLLVIPGPFALAGIYTIGQRAVRGKGVKWRLLWDGVKEFGLRSFVLFLITLAGYAIIVANLVFYNSPELSPFSKQVAFWVTPIFVLLGIVWTGIVFYAQSFLMELKEPTIWLALRNSFFLVMLKPLPTLVYLIVSAVAIVLSILLPVLILVAPGFISVLSLAAVRTLIGDLTERVEAMEEEIEEEEALQEHATSEDITANAQHSPHEDRS